MKIFFRRIHLYMGLATGIIIMITCFSGAILVFEKELQQLFHKERYFTEANGTRLSTDSMIARVQSEMPDAKPGSIKIYNNPERNAEVAVTKPSPEKKKVKGKGEEGIRLVAFVDPYSGEVKEFYNHRKSFFYFTMDVHRWMLGGDVGKMIVGICTLIFLFILITGIILWWPKNKQILKQRLKIKSGAGFKRLNHDYHVVLGFYSAIFLFILAFTGLAWSFEWFNKGIYTVTGSKMVKPDIPKNTAVLSNTISSELILQTVINKADSALYYTVALPKDSTSPFTVTLLPYNATHESASDTYYVDAYSGIISSSQKFSEKNLGQRVRATFKPVHVASIYGTPSKIIGFIVCLLGTFFPLTGIIMWVNRTWKKKKVK